MNKELPSVYQSIIHRSRYSHYLYDEKRRETCNILEDYYGFNRREYKF